jgi:DNA-binding CsgD family transcriptional regulator/tetratricopeptide (TPR) repeat protein
MALILSIYNRSKMSVATLSTYSAVQLFVDRARRVRPDFSLEREAEPVFHICQMVEGMPLALELAASWLKSLSCHEIAAEIAHNREFLASRLRNVPERHRSLQAIFSQTWTGLNAEEQAVFQRLAVFCGGFLRDAALAVTSASLSLLSTLLDKSLLRWETGEGGNGRYQIHELLRQFAAEKLAANPETEAETRARHAHYFAAFVADRTDDLLGGRQLEAMHEIEAELNNVRTAWQWVIDHREAQLLFSMGAALNPFYWYQSRFREARDVFTAATACLESCPASPERDLILAATLTNQAWFMMIAGINELGRQWAERALDMYETLGQPPVHGLDTDPRLILGIIYRHSERVPEALAHLHNAAAEAETRPNPINRQCAHRLLAQTYHMIGRLELAEEHGRIACELADRQNDLWGAAYNQDTMGRIALTRADYETAARYFQTGYALHRQLRFAQGLADICLQLADLYLSQEDAAQAEKYATEGLVLYQKSKTLHAIVAMQTRLAHAQLLAQELEKGRIHLLTAADMGMGHETVFPDILFYLLIVAADLVWRIDQGLTGLRWLAAAVNAPQLWSVHQQYARKLLDRWQISPDSSAWETAVQQTTSFTLAGGLAEIMSVLAASLDETTPEIEQTAKETAVAANQSLLEPLTNRELEVLQLIATGLSNQQIAEELFISIGTVKYYTSHIYGKLQVPSRTQAIVYARELGILP